MLLLRRIPGNANLPIRNLLFFEVSVAFERRARRLRTITSTSIRSRPRIFFVGAQHAVPACPCLPAGGRQAGPANVLGTAAPQSPDAAIGFAFVAVALLLHRRIPNVAPHLSAADFSPLANLRGHAIVPAKHTVPPSVFDTIPLSSPDAASLLLCPTSSIPPIHPAISIRSSSDVCDSFHS